MTATDLVLTVTQMLRKKGVVNKFVEFYGPGLDHLTLADRATIANMAPEYGATCGFFPVDGETLRYLELSGRPAEHRIALVEAYAKAQGLFRVSGSADPVFTDTLSLDLGDRGAVDGRPEAPAGPRRARRTSRPASPRRSTANTRSPARLGKRVKVEGRDFDARPRRRGDRRHHLLHQHLQPSGADRRRPARPQRGGRA